MTVGELIKQLERFDDNLPVVVINITPDETYTMLDEVFASNTLKINGVRRERVVCLQGE